MHNSQAHRPKFNLTGLLLLTATIGAAFGVSFAITLRWSNPQLAAPALFGGLQLFNAKDFPGQRLEHSDFQGAEAVFERAGGEGSAQESPEEPPVMHEDVLPRTDVSTDLLSPEQPAEPDLPAADPPLETYSGRSADESVSAPVESEPVVPATDDPDPSAAYAPTPEPTAPTAPAAP
jgi:hypothetical protein